MKQFDIKMQVLFCEKHKKIFDTKVKIKVGKHLCIRPQELVDLWREAENCLDCKWKTNFA